MADIQVSTGKNKRGRKKLSTKVDLTPMVDLGFLLITFFILTTTWAEARALRFYLPADGIPSKAMESATLTVIPGKNNQVFYYHGILSEALQSGAYGFTTFNLQTGVGQLIREKKEAMNQRKAGSAKDLILIITPTAQASYQNMVDALDETLINDVKHYTVTDQDAAQIALLAKAGKIDADF